jgi:hypothetical protein
MGIARKLLMGGCALAILAAGASAGGRKSAGAAICASSAENSAMRIIAVQQELMDAALTCGDAARANYNSFQTVHNAVLRKYDKTMLTMFRRLMGRKGDAEYNSFKTGLASKAELRRIQHAPNFCAAAAAKAQTALAAKSAELDGFVAGTAVEDFAWPVEECSVMATRLAPIPDIVPEPNPLRVAEAAIPPAGAASSAVEQAKEK